MRTGRVLLAASIALAAFCVALFLSSNSTDGVRFPSATAAPTTSGRGDAPPRRRAPAADVSPSADETPSSDVDDSAQPSEEEEPPPRPCRVLRIVDEAGVPLPGVSVDGVYCGHGCNATDADGETRVDVVDPASRVAFVDGAETRTFDLRDARTQVVLKSPLKLDVSVVDAMSGVALDPVQFELERGRGADSPQWTCGPPPSLWRDEYGETTFAVSIAPPTGYGGYRRIEWKGPVAERARVVRFVVPMFEATERTLRVRRPDGHPAVGATVSAACVAEGQTHCDRDAAAVTWSAEPSSAAGLVRVLGLPRIPFTRLRIDVSWTHERDGVEEWLTGVARGIDLSAAQSPDPIDVVLAAPVEEHGPSSASGCGGPAVVEGPTAALALRVRYRDGAPARRVRIETDHGSTWTDADGRARFDALPVGRAPFVAFAHGFAPTRFEVEVGETATVDVVEVESRPVRVVVCDESGRPAPSALVLAKCGNVAWPPGGSRAVDCGLAQLDGDVEDVAPRTDRTGTVVLRVPRYRIDITASLGDATSWAWTDADEVVMTLREPDRTPPASAQVEDEASDEPR